MLRNFLLSISLITLFSCSLSAQSWVEIADSIFDAEQRVWSMKMVDDSVVWACSAIGWGGGGNVPTVYRSTDNGYTWDSRDFSVFHGTQLALDVAPVNSEVAYLALNDFGPSPDILKKTTDGGQTWQDVSSLQYNATYVHFFDENDGIVLAGDMGAFKICLTDDGGDTWTYLAGQNWEEPPGTSIPDSIHPNDRPEIGYCMYNGSYAVKGDIFIFSTHYGYFWVSKDRGYHWEQVQISDFHEQGYLPSVVSILDEDRYLFFADGDTSYNFLPNFISAYTPDGGATWITGTPSVNTSVGQYLGGADSTFVICGQYGFTNVHGTDISKDFGQTWQRVSDRRILAADWRENGTGVGTFGDAVQFGNFVENGKVYAWDFPPTVSNENVVRAGTNFLMPKPNPVQDFMLLDLPEAFADGGGPLEFRYFTGFGQQSGSIQVPASRTVRINTTSLPAGAYQFALRQGDMVRYGRFLKQ